MRAVFQWDIPQIAAAGIAPQLEHIEMLSTSIDAQSQQPTADDESVSSLDTETSKSLKSLLQKAFQQSKRIKTQDGKSLVCIRQLYNTIKSLKESTHETLEFQMLSLKSHQSLKDWIETLTSDYKFHSNPKDSHSLLVEYAPNTKDGVATSGNSVKSEIIIKDKSSSTNQSVTPSSSSSTSNVLIEQNMKFASIEASKTSVPASSQIQLSSLLLRFEDLYKVEGPYFMCDQSSVATVSNWLHTIPLSLADRYADIALYIILI